MADEITYTLGLQCVNQDLLVDVNDKTRYADQTGRARASGSPSIPTTSAGTALSFTSISTPGFAHFVNLDTANYVEIGVQVAGTFYPFAKLEAGEAALIPLANTTFYARANTAAVRLDYVVLER